MPKIQVTFLRNYKEHKEKEQVFVVMKQARIWENLGYVKISKDDVKKIDAADEKLSTKVEKLNTGALEAINAKAPTKAPSKQTKKK